MLVSDAHEGLLRERRTKVSRDAFDDAPRGATQSGVAFVARLRECCRGCFAQDCACATRHVFVGRILTAELEEEIGIVILSEKPEQHATRVGKWGRVSVP